MGPGPRFLGQSGTSLSTEIKCKGALRVRWKLFLKVASYQSNALFKYVSPILSKHSAFESVLRSYDFGSEHSLRQINEKECKYQRATSYQVSLCQERCPSSTGSSTQLYNEIYSAEL